MQRGQSTIEFAVIIACVVAALLAMQVYIKRGISGRLRSAADGIGQQYDPRNTDSDITISLDSDVTTTVKTDNGETGDGIERLKTTTTVDIEKEVEKRKGYEKVGELGPSL